MKSYLFPYMKNYLFLYMTNYIFSAIICTCWSKNKYKYYIFHRHDFNFHCNHMDCNVGLTALSRLPLPPPKSQSQISVSISFSFRKYGGHLFAVVSFPIFPYLVHSTNSFPSPTFIWFRTTSSAPLLLAKSIREKRKCVCE